MIGTRVASLPRPSRLRGRLRALPLSSAASSCRRAEGGPLHRRTWRRCPAPRRRVASASAAASRGALLECRACGRSRSGSGAPNRRRYLRHALQRDRDRSDVSGLAAGAEPEEARNRMRRAGRLPRARTSRSKPSSPSASRNPCPASRPRSWSVSPARPRRARRHRPRGGAGTVRHARRATCSCSRRPAAADHIRLRKADLDAGSRPVEVLNVAAHRLPGRHRRADL